MQFVWNAVFGKESAEESKVTHKKNCTPWVWWNTLILSKESFSLESSLSPGYPQRAHLQVGMKVFLLVTLYPLILVCPCRSLKIFWLCVLPPTLSLIISQCPRPPPLSVHSSSEWHLSLKQHSYSRAPKTNLPRVIIRASFRLTFPVPQNAALKLHQTMMSS